MSFEAENWHSCEEYLYGVDLFNHGFWWEAHEALETVWLAAGGRHTETGTFIQGLIQITVAHLKWFSGIAGYGNANGIERTRKDAAYQRHLPRDRV